MTPRRIFAAFRSRRLAIWLLVSFTAYALVAVIWKIPNPYSNPVFWSLAGLLTLATAFCAWERTALSVRALRRSRAFGGTRSKGRIAGSSFSVPLGEGLSEREVLVAVAAGFGSCGLHSDLGEETAVGSSHNAGYLGSPLFHWALVALFVFASLGQLTRFEGLVRVVTGGSVTDVASSYGSGSPAGPLFFGRYTGATIGVDRIDPDYEAGGSKRGPSPRVIVTAGGRVRDQRYVYPNSPAAFWPLTIHRDAIGPALLVGFTFPNGQELAHVPAFFTPPSEGASLQPSSLEVSSITGDSKYSIEIRPLRGRRVVISIASPGFSSAPVAAGGTVRLPDGTTLRVESFTTYSRLRVVNDWTVLFVFASLWAALLGCALSLFWPPRRAVAKVDAECGILEVRTSRRNTDPAFPSRVEKAVRLALEPITKHKESA